MLKRLRHRWSRRAPRGPAESIDLAGFSPFDPAFINDPFPYLSALREHSAAFPLDNGSWVISRYNDIQDALAHPHLCNSPSDYAVVHQRHRHSQVCADVANNILPFLDAPQHTQPRAALTRGFHQLLRDCAIDIEALAQTRLQALMARREFDVLHDFATPLCAEIMGKLLGFNADPALAKQLKRWSETFFYLFSIIPSEEVRDTLNRELTDFRHFAETLHTTSASPLMSVLEGADLGEFTSPTGFIRDNTLLLIADGLNSDHGIGNALRHCILQPELLTGLREQRYRALDLADELLRFDSPTLFIARRTSEAVSIGDTVIEKNRGVFLMLAAGNRDPRVFDQADEINPLRSGPAPISFGRGEHSCVGRQLVRQMLAASLHALAAQPHTLRLSQPNSRWTQRAGHRWLEALPVHT